MKVVNFVMDSQTTLPSSPPPSRCSDVNNDSNMMSYLNSNNIESLPDELLFDILVRLPPECLCHRAKLVCRRWCHIIRSHAFVNTHNQQHSTYGLLMALTSHRGHPHAIYVTATQGRIETCKLNRINSNEFTTASSSCNGLVMGVNDDKGGSRSMHVLNPATKQSFLLPLRSRHNRSIYNYHTCIAYSAASMKYKVSQPYYEYGQGWRLDIVTVGVDKSWRHVKIPPGCDSKMRFDVYPVSSEGFLHWGRGRYCVTLNVETEVVTMIEAPIPSDQCDQYYLSTGRYLTVLVYLGGLSWQVWELTPAESGVQWIKVLPNIDLGDKRRMLQQRFAFRDDNNCLWPVGWVNYPEVLVFFDSGVRTCIYYNLETRAIDKIDFPHKPCTDYLALVHRNSVVWLSQD